MGIEEELKKLEKEKKDKEDKTQTEIQDWRLAVTKLYQDITKWLKPSIDAKLIQIITTDIPISGGPLGAYKMPKLEITMNNKTVVFEPTNRAGVTPKGRISVYLKQKTNEKWSLRRLVDSAKNSSWEFYRPGEREFIETEEFNQKVLDEKLCQWVKA